VKSGTRFVAIAVIFIAGLVIGWGVTRFVPLPFLGGGGDRDVSTTDVAVDDQLANRDVAALGRIEPAGGIVMVSALPGDRLKSLSVAEGDTVAKAGNVIGELDSYELRELEVQSFDARLKEAAARETAETNLAESRIIAAQLAEEQAKSKGLELESQKKQVEVLQKSLELEQEKLAAIADVSHNLISDQEKRQQALLVDKLSAELSAAQSMVTQLEQTSQLVLKAARADVEAAKTAKDQIKATIPTASLEAGRQAAIAQRERSIIKAPIAGTVLAVYTRAGEHIANQPVLQMANLDKLVCVAEVYENDLRRVDKGQTAIIHSKVFKPEVNKKGLTGTVVHVGNIIAAAKLQPLDPFARTDRHVVEVRIELHLATQDEIDAAKLVNLQVDVTIKTGDAGSQVAAK
jgi:HlyD family secretion protein